MKISIHFSSKACKSLGISIVQEIYHKYFYLVFVVNCWPQTQTYYENPLITAVKFYRMRLCRPPDGSTSPKYKLLCFIINKICKEKNALAFNRDRCCHLVLCLQLTPFHWLQQVNESSSCCKFCFNLGTVYYNKVMFIKLWALVEKGEIGYWNELLHFMIWTNILFKPLLKSSQPSMPSLES